MEMSSGLGVLMALAALPVPEAAASPTVARPATSSPVAVGRMRDLLRTVIPPEIALSAPAPAGHSDTIRPGVGNPSRVPVKSLPVPHLPRVVTGCGHRAWSLVRRGG